MVRTGRLGEQGNHAANVGILGGGTMSSPVVLTPLTDNSAAEDAVLAIVGVKNAAAALGVSVSASVDASLDETSFEVHSFLFAD